MGGLFVRLIVLMFVGMLAMLGSGLSVAREGRLPSSGQLSYMRYDSGNPEIYLYDIGMNRHHNLTRNPNYDGIASWSPDGQKMAFISDRDGLPHLYLIDFARRETRQITEQSFGYAAFRWMPDGEHLRILNGAPQALTLQTITVSDGTVTTETITDANSDFIRDLDVDETQAALDDQRYTARARFIGSQWRLVVQDRETFETVASYPLGEMIEPPAFSSDGERLVYMMVERGQTILVLVEMDEQTSRPLLRAGSRFAWVSWRP